HREIFPSAVLTVQKEMGQRLCAVPGSKQFGSLSVLLQSSYLTERAFDLRPGSFFPPPQVSSTVVKLRRLPDYFIEMDELPELQRLLRAAFRWRRKQLLNILKAEYELTAEAAGELLAGAGIAPSQRPEQLAVAEFALLMRRLACLDRGSG
ncbi:MAG: rRNA adenine N-6-methyltransferase family protein, partial [bacterium]